MSGDAIPIFSLTIDPLNPDTVWSGTQGERGIYKSTDGGVTWVKSDNGVIENDGITFRGFTVDPASSNTVYAAAEISSWVWNGEPLSGREFDMTKGVVYRTTDGGQNWQELWRGDNLARYVWIDPRDTDVIYISTGIFDREAANSDKNTNDPGGEGILKSTDGGQTWQQKNNGLNNLYVGTLFMHPTDPDILIAGTGNNAYVDNSGVYLTTDGGETWTNVLSDENINAIEICTANPLIAYAGSAGFIYRSEDGGVTWNSVTGASPLWGPPGIQAGFPIDFQVDPGDPDQIFANNYGGGNFLSTDGGSTWSTASDGYTGAQVRAISASPAAPGQIFAAARSGFFGSNNGGGSWTGLGTAPATGLEWNAVAVDPADSKHVLAASNWHGTIMETKDGAQTWNVTQLSQLEEGHSWRTIVFAPSDNSIVYAGTGAFFSAGQFSNNLPSKGIYKSQDGGTTWSSANDTISQNTQVSALAIAPNDHNVVYAATTTQGVLKTNSGGQSWTVLNNGLPATPTVLSIAIHPSEGNTLYVGLESAGLYRSEDGGTTWQSVAAGLNPEANISDIIFDPGDDTTIYFSDSLSGVYRSEDKGDTWLTSNNGLRMRSVNDLEFSADGRHLYAATEGEGVYRLDLYGVAPASP
jgi:photosystem II stability/assembly factor-like uncharacterized protein